MSKQEEIKVVLRKHRTCKHSVRYDVDQSAAVAYPAIASIYVRNSAVDALGDPEVISVMIKKGA